MTIVITPPAKSVANRAANRSVICLFVFQVGDDKVQQYGPAVWSSIFDAVNNIGDNFGHLREQHRLSFFKSMKHHQNATKFFHQCFSFSL